MAIRRPIKYYLFWNERINFLAIAKCKRGALPLVQVLDEEYKGENPFWAWPLIYLSMVGWHDMGELK